MLLASLFAAPAIAGSLHLDVDVHGHTAQIALEDVAACVKHTASFGDASGWWDLHLEAGPLESGEVWMQVEVYHRWMDGKDRHEVRVRPSFVAADGEIASLTVSDDVRVELTATGLGEVDFACVPRELSRSRREESRVRSLRVAPAAD